MKKNVLIFGVLLGVLIGCNNKRFEDDTHFKPARGVKVGDMQVPINQDSLNKSVFGITIIADSLGRLGVYNVNAVSGNNTANSMFTMPKGAETYKPLIKKRPNLYTYVIGFHIPDDTTFYEYYEIASTDNTITMKYIKSYTFQ